MGDPKTVQLLAVGAVAIFQLFCAIRVMRAAAEAGLAGAGRMVPVLLSLFIPVGGPLIGGRATGAGLRPVLLSLVGVVIGGGLYLSTMQPTGARPVPAQTAAQSTPAAAGQPAPATKGQTPAAAAPPAEDAAAAEPAAKSAEPAARPAAPVVKPADPPVVTPAAEPAAKALTPTVVAPPVERPLPVAVARPLAAPVGATSRPTILPTSVAMASSSQAAATGLTAAGDISVGWPGVGGQLTPAMLLQRRVQVEGQLLLPGPNNRGAVLEHYLARTPVNNTRLLFAAALTRPPRQFVAPQLYVGGRVYYFSDVADYFPACPIPPANIVEGQSVALLSYRGNFLAEIRFTEVVLDDAGQVKTAALDVRIR